MAGPPSGVAELVAELEPVVDRLRRTFESGVSRPLAWRRKALQSLRRMFEESVEVRA